jgi:DNA repair exonuclease SbcCD ATPase subunit
MRKKIDISDLRSNIEVLSVEKSELDKAIASLSKARNIVSKTGVLAQQEIKEVIEELVTQALQSVFGVEYSFEVDNQIQRNKPETNLYVVIEGYRHSLKEDLGGGVLDLAAFCLRVVLWAINSPRTSTVVVLDEPFKALDKVRLEKAGLMIKKLSEMLGLQFIIITHEDQLIDAADSAYYVKKVNGISEVSKVI